MTTEVIPAEAVERQVSRSVLDASPVEFKAALERRGANRKALLEWVRASLVDGTDFGRIKIKGREGKPSLWKPGAEKICGMLGVTAVFPTMPEYEKVGLEGRAIEQVVIRCHLYSADGQVVADGIGARSLAQDGGDLNKALKMSCKSAHIDATLRMAGLSEVFTQDIEDMKDLKESPGLDPRGEEWKHVDTKLLNKYVTELRKHFSREPIDELGILEITEELKNPDAEAMKIAVWSKLAGWEKDFIHALIKSHARPSG